MSAHRATTTLLRRSVALVSLGFVAVLLPSPASASMDPPTATLVKSASFDNDPLARDIARTESDYRLANENVQLLSEHSAMLAQAADDAEAEAERLYDVVRDQDGGGFLSTVSGFLQRGDSDLDQATAAAEDAEHARALANLSAEGVAAAIARSETARTAWETALGKAAQLGTKQAARLAAQTAARQSQFRRSYKPASKAEDALNQRALNDWLDYLNSLAHAAVLPPNAQELGHLRPRSAGFDPVRDATGRVVPGVAEVDSPDTAPLVVLPSQTIRAVAEAFSRVGLRTGSDATGPAAYACGGLVAKTWSAAGTGVPSDSLAQWRELRQVPLPQLQVGDVVVLGSEQSGLTGSGVYLGRDLVIAADEEGGHVAVRKVAPHEVYGARRATLPNHQARPEPAVANCGLVEEAAESVIASPGPLRFPVADGSYSMSAGFGDSGGLWSSGAHTGQDFAAPIGTPVYASADGTVTLQETYWAGTLVRIEHGAGVETLYAHMSRVDVTDGQTVAAGAPIGAVGSRGNSTGPHLHFEVRLDGLAVDPMAVLTPTSFSDGGTFVNGAIPETALCSATVGGTQHLRCDAAVAFRVMSADYEAATGTSLCITDSYRSRDLQERVFRTKPNLAALPGTSNHGWGVAVDLCGGVERFGTPEHEWVSSNGPTYGWIHPDWAAESGSRPEPWHFEYAG